MDDYEYFEAMFNSEVDIDAGKNREIENEESNKLLFKIATEFYDKQMVIYIQEVR